jgi:hypothetical protein
MDANLSVLLISTLARRVSSLCSFAVYFLKRRSKASRASLALRGGGVFTPGAGGRPAPCEDVDSLATVTRPENRGQSFA